MFLAADRGLVTYNADSRQSVRFKFPVANEPQSQLTWNLHVEHPLWCINHEDLKNLQSQFLYFYSKAN